MRNISGSLGKMANGMRPVIGADVPIGDVAVAFKRMKSRHRFGKTVVGF